MADRYDAQRLEVARACRVMARTGLAEDILGHVSARVTSDRLLLRCRGPQEAGLRFTNPGDIGLIDLGGQGELADGYRVPNEYPIHTGVLRARPDVFAVVHAHPRSVVALTMTGRSVQPIVGAFDIPAMRLAERGVPVFPRSCLVSTDELANEMVGVLGDADAVILAGHGLVTVGRTVAAAMLCALAIDRLARITLDVLQAGGEPTPVTAEDSALLPDLGGAFNEDTLWRFHLRSLASDGLDVGEGFP